MFSLAINSICDCWRSRSLSIAAAISGTPVAKSLLKKPVARSANGETAEEIARTTPLGVRIDAYGSANFARAYHMSVEDVSRLPEIAFANSAVENAMRPGQHPIRQISD